MSYALQPATAIGYCTGLCRPACRLALLRSRIAALRRATVRCAPTYLLIQELQVVAILRGQVVKCGSCEVALVAADIRKNVAGTGADSVARPPSPWLLPGAVSLAMYLGLICMAPGCTRRLTCSVRTLSRRKPTNNQQLLRAMTFGDSTAMRLPDGSWRPTATHPIMTRAPALLSWCALASRRSATTNPLQTWPLHLLALHPIPCALTLPPLLPHQPASPPAEPGGPGGV